MNAYSTRRQNDVNFGNRSRVVGDAIETLAWVSIDRSVAWTIYATAKLSGLFGLANVEPIINIEWGNGGTSVSCDYPVGRRLRVPVVASMVRVTGRIANMGAGPLPSGVSCEFSAFIAQGLDGEDVQNTRVISRTGAWALVARGAQRLLGVDGFNAQTAGPPRWVMFFDSENLPPDGAAPVAVVPAAPSPSTFSLTRPRDVRNGAVWAVSSSPLTLTHDANAEFYVDAELLL